MLIWILGSTTEKVDEVFTSPSVKGSIRSESIGDEEEKLEVQNTPPSLKDEGSDGVPPPPEMPSSVRSSTAPAVAFSSFEEPPKEAVAAAETEESFWGSPISQKKPKKKGARGGWTFD